MRNNWWRGNHLKLSSSEEARAPSDPIPKETQISLYNPCWVRQILLDFLYPYVHTVGRIPGFYAHLTHSEAWLALLKRYTPWNLDRWEDRHHSEYPLIEDSWAEENRFKQMDEVSQESQWYASAAMETGSPTYLDQVCCKGDVILWSSPWWLQEMRARVVLV